jgi:hypothetical protein
MKSIKQAKIQVVIRQFEAQLIKEAKLEENKISEKIQIEYLD